MRAYHQPETSAAVPGTISHDGTVTEWQGDRGPARYVTPCRAALLVVSDSSIFRSMAPSSAIGARISALCFVSSASPSNRPSAAARHRSPGIRAWVPLLVAAACLPSRTINQSIAALRVVSSASLVISPEIKRNCGFSATNAAANNGSFERTRSGAQPSIAGCNR